MLIEKVLVIGASGQLGSVLVQELLDRYPTKKIIAADIRPMDGYLTTYEKLDAMDRAAITQIVKKHRITQIYHMAAILSASGEKAPLQTWEKNTTMLLNVLEVARLQNVSKVFYPSSIAVFGNFAAKNQASQLSNLNPSTVYGISKAAGEQWAQYYFTTYGLDVRSVRFPGIVGYQSIPAGGTTDYAVAVFHAAVTGQAFECYLQADTILPMMYMDDAINAMLKIMEASRQAIKIRTSYNISGTSFSPAILIRAIKRYYPNFSVTYKPDFRQGIADNWPDSIDDISAFMDWGWSAKFAMEKLTEIMILQLETQYRTRKQVI